MNEPVAQADQEFAQISAEIVAAFVSNNALSPSDLPKLIAEVYAAIKGLKHAAKQEIAQVQQPAVSVRKSVTPDYLICLEDGKKFKSLKRHLRATYNMTPDEYRAKWNLPSDYPMVAASYSATRSALAKSNGLGRREDVALVSVEPAPPSKKSRKAAVSAA